MLKILANGCLAEFCFPFGGYNFEIITGRFASGFPDVMVNIDEETADELNKCIEDCKFDANFALTEDGRYGVLSTPEGPVFLECDDEGLVSGLVDFKKSWPNDFKWNGCSLEICKDTYGEPFIFTIGYTFKKGLEIECHLDKDTFVDLFATNRIDTSYSKRFARVENRDQLHGILLKKNMNGEVRPYVDDKQAQVLLGWTSN